MKELQNIGEMDWALVGKYLNGEATPEEAEKLEKWSNQSDENRAVLLECRQMLEKTDSFYRAKKFDSRTAWQKVSRNSGVGQPKTVRFKPARKTAISRFYKYAAILIIAAVAGTSGYYFGFKNIHDDTFETVASSESQMIDEFVLPDGTVVSLNSNSELIFPKEFKPDVREVTISGEAFFDVTPNLKKPFIIHAGRAQVKVLGTSFSVRAYPGNETVEVVVETGKVQVTSENKEEKEPLKQPEITLTKGEKGVLFNNSLKLEKSVNTNHNFLAWKTQNLIFNETPLSEVVDYLEKVYHVEIRLTEPELRNLTLTATFNKKPVDFVLNVIQLTFKLELTTENDLFILSNQKKEHANR